MNKIKLISLLISLSLIFTNQTPLAVSQVINTTPIEQQSVLSKTVLPNTNTNININQNFVLPANIGKITSSKNFNSDEIVINIQDLHCHSQAQRNIAKIIEQLDNTFNLDTIYLEGASGTIDVQWLISANQTQVGKNFINLLLENGRISGGEYYSAIKGKNNFIQGIEEKNLYDTNIKLLQEINSFKSDINSICDELENQLKEVKNIYFNKDITKFNEIKTKDSIYYYKNLDKILKANKIDTANYNELAEYIKYLNLKQTIKDDAVKSEFYDFIDKLKNQVSYSKYKDLVAKSNNFTNIENIVDEMLSTKSITKYKQLYNFVTLLKQKQSINPTLLLYQEQKLTEDLYNKFSKNKYEERVTFLSNFVKNIRNYFTAQITAKEYNEFAQDYAKFKKYWNDYCIRNIPQKLEKYEYIVEKYHKNNIKRDQIFTNQIIGTKSNINKETKSDINLTNLENKKIKLIVTGGFHSAGIENILNNNKISYVIITPVVTESFNKSNSQHLDTIDKYAQILNNTINIPTITETILKETILPDIIPIIIESSLNIKDEIVVKEVNSIFRTRLKQRKLNDDIKSFKLKIEYSNGEKVFHVAYKNNKGLNKDIYYNSNGEIVDLTQKASIVKNKESLLSKFSYVWEEIVFRIIPITLSLLPQILTANIVSLSVLNPLTIGVMAITTVGFALAHTIYDRANGNKTDNRFKQLLAPSIAFSATYFIGSLILSPYIAWIIPIISHYAYNKLVEKGILKTSKASIVNEKLTPEEMKTKDLSLRLPFVVNSLKELFIEDVQINNINKYEIYKIADIKEDIIFILKFYNRYEDVLNIITKLDNIQQRNKYTDEELKVIEQSLKQLYSIVKTDIIDSTRLPEALPKPNLIQSCLQLDIKRTISNILYVALPLTIYFPTIKEKVSSTNEADNLLLSDFREVVRVGSLNEYNYWGDLTKIADMLYFDGIRNEKAIYLVLRGQDFAFDYRDKPTEAKFVQDGEKARSFWNLIISNDDSTEIITYSNNTRYNDDMIVDSNGFTLTKLVSLLPNNLRLPYRKQKGTTFTGKLATLVHNIDDYINLPEVDIESLFKHSDQENAGNIYDEITNLDLLAKESFYKFCDTKKTIQETKELADKMFSRIQDMINLLKQVESSVGDVEISNTTQQTLETIKQDLQTHIENNTVSEFINKHKQSFAEGSIDKLISTLHQELLQQTFNMYSKFKIIINNNTWNYSLDKITIKSDSIEMPSKIKDLFLRLTKLSGNLEVSDIVINGNRIIFNYSPKSHHEESKSLIIDFGAKKITSSGFWDLKDYEEDTYSVALKYEDKAKLEEEGFTDVQDYDVNTSYRGADNSTKVYNYSKIFNNTNIFLEEAYRQVLIHFYHKKNILDDDSIELKNKLNNILKYLLLPEIPENIKLKSDYQIQMFFNDVIEKAYAKGLIVINSNGELEPIASTAKECEQKYIENLLFALEQDYNTYQEGFRNAQAINALFIAENFYVNSTDADLSVGKEALRIVSRTINLQNGNKIILNGILDTEKERFPWLKAELMDANGTKTIIDNTTLINLLNSNGFNVKQQPPRNKGEINRTFNMLRETTQMKYNTPNISGDVISKTKKGYTIGEITYDKENSEGKIYVGPSLFAGEADVLDKMKGAIVTSGGIYSHGSTQVRESETIATLVNGQWIDNKLQIKCSMPISQSSTGKYNVVKYKTIDKTLEEGSIVLMKIINSERTNIFVFSNDIKDDLKYLVDLVGNKDIDGIKQYLLSDKFKNLSRTNSKQLLELIYFEIISNKGLEDLLTFLIKDISNEDIKDLNENYIKMQINDIKQKIAGLDLEESIDIALNYVRIKELIIDINKIYDIVDKNDKELTNKLEELLLTAIKYRNNLDSALKQYIKNFKTKCLQYIEASSGKLNHNDIRNIQVLIREGKWTRYFGNNAEVKKMIESLSDILSNISRKSERTVRKLDNIWDEKYGGKAFGLSEIKRFLKDERFEDITRGVKTLDGFGINPEKLTSLQKYNNDLKELENIRQQILNTTNITSKKQLTRKFKTLATQTINFLNDNKDIIIKEITTVTAELISKDKMYAVRSSGMGEDGVNSTFAGLADSYLNIKAEMVPEYIFNTILSFFNENAFDYIIRNGIVRPRVFVQEFGNMDEAGVIFSDTTNYKLTIEVVKGLGMTLVDGDFSPDHIEVNSNGSYVLLRGLNNTIKKVASSEWGVEEKILTAAEKQERLLSTEQILQIQKVTRALKKYYGSAIDVEFGVINGTLYLLQVRSVTTLIDDWSFDEYENDTEQERVLVLDRLINQLFHRDTIELKVYDSIYHIDWANALKYKNIQPIVRGQINNISNENILTISYPIDDIHSKSIKIYVDNSNVKPIIFVDCEEDELDKVIELVKERINEDPVIKAKIVSLLYPTLTSKIKRFVGIKDGYLGDIGAKIQTEFKTDFNTISLVLEQLNINSIIKISKWMDTVGKQSIEKCNGIYNLLKPIIDNKLIDDSYLQQNDLLEYKYDIIKLVEYLETDNFDVPNINKNLLILLNISTTDINTIKIIKLIMDISSSEKRAIALSILDDIDYLITDSPKVNQFVEKDITTIDIRSMLASA